MDMQFNQTKRLNETYKHETVCIETADGRFTGLIEWRDDCEKGRQFYDSDQDPLYQADIISWSFGECVSNADCVKWKNNVLFLDNTLTTYVSDYTISFINEDGSVTEANFTGQTGWTNQVDHWANVLSTLYPDAKIETRCNIAGGCGGLNPPPSDVVVPSGIIARYVSLIFCPTDKHVPVQAIITDSSTVAHIGRNLVLKSAEGKELRGKICRTCDDDDVLRYSDGTIVPEADIPTCLFDCAETIPLPVETVCSFSETVGCDNVDEPEDNTNWVNITRIATQCGAGEQIYNYVIQDPTDATALIDYTLVGEFVDCNTGETLEPPVDLCKDTRRSPIDTCFLPDQYAIQWSWAGNGQLTSFNALTNETAYHGITQYNATTVGGYALAFKNDTVEPTIFYQVAGKLYKSDPTDPINTFILVGSTSPATSSYPCFDFDPSGRLLVGDGRRAWELDPTTGAGVYLGTLIDVRDGANLNVSPGDWFFDPNGKWLMMARDNRGASFLDADGNPYCTGTCVWEIDPSTLEATRVSPSCSPVSGTGASWLSASQYLLSTGGGEVYAYNKGTDTWDVFYNTDDNTSGVNTSINDLAPQWVIPEPIRVIGWIDSECTSNNCEPVLFTLIQNEDFSVSCERFYVTVPGKFGICEPEPNPFVSDPFSPSDGSGCDRCPDQVWHEGCSSAGFTRWRVGYDSAGNEIIEYIYGTLTEPVTATPNKFSRVPCGEQNSRSETTTWCNLDTDTQVFRKEFPAGGIIWFDETGNISEPPNKVPGPCEQSDPLLPITQETICLNGIGYVRQVRVVYVENSDGLPELATTQIIYFNEDGVLWDSGVVPSGTDLPAGEPTGYYLGDCQSEYIESDNITLCESDDEKLLLIDSGGGFAEYSYETEQWENISSISIASAGGSADPDNFTLYNFTSPDNLIVTDVNTKQIVNTLTLTTTDGSPLTFSAAAFDVTDGFLYAHNNDKVYRTDVNTGVVTEYLDFTGVSGSGTSMAIDFSGRMIITGSVGRVYEIDRVTGVATLIYTSSGGVANGATFDADGYLYLTGGPNTYKVNLNTNTEEQIIDDWTPGANSIAYYRTLAGKPACFHRRYGIKSDGSRELIGDFYIGTDTPRVISGAVGCCMSTGGGTSDTVSIDNFPTNKESISEVNICAGDKTPLVRKTVIDSNGVETTTFNDENGEISEPAVWVYGDCDCETITYYEIENVTQGLNNREWFDTGNVIEQYDTPDYSESVLDNFDTSLTPDVTTVVASSVFATNDTNNTAGVQDYQRREGYIFVKEPVYVRFDTNSEGYMALWLGDCGGEPQRVISHSKLVGVSPTNSVLIQKGVHRVRLDNLDNGGSNSNWTVYTSTDGINFSANNTYFDAISSTTAPNIVCKKGSICNGVEYDENDVIITFSDTILRCKPECTPKEVQPVTPKHPVTTSKCSIGAGSYGKRWIATNANVNPALDGSTAILNSFSATDGYGLPAHTNTPDVEGVEADLNVDNDWLGLSASSTVNADIGEAYILVPNGSTAVLRVDGSANEIARVYMGNSPSDANIVHEHNNSPATTDVDFAKITGDGCNSKWVRIYVVDPGTDNSQVQITWSLDGAAFANIPTEYLSNEPFSCSSDIQWVSEDAQPVLDISSGFLGDCKCCNGVTSNSSNQDKEYVTTFDSEFFASAFVVPSPPANTKKVLVFNQSNAWLELGTNYGTQIIPPNGTVEFSVNDYESGINITGVTILNGNFTGSDSWGINYRTAS